MEQTRTIVVHLNQTPGTALLIKILSDPILRNLFSDEVLDRLYNTTLLDLTLLKDGKDWILTVSKTEQF